MLRREHVERGDRVDDVASDAPDEDCGGAGRCVGEIHRGVFDRLAVCEV